MIQLVLIDVDGTLTGRTGTIHPTVAPALAAAHARGLHLGVCTGRPGMGEALALARTVSPAGLHIFYNGAAVVRLHHDAPDETAFQSAMSPASVRALVAAARAHGHVLEVYAPGAVFIDRPDPVQRRHAELIGIDTTVTDLASLEVPVLKAQWVVPLDAMPEIERLTAAIEGVEMGTGAHAEMPGVMFASVTRRGTSKRAAATWLAAQYGLDLAQVAMVGDGDGDLELIEHAGLGIAMGNATDRVRAAARHVVADVDEGGLAEALRLALTPA